MSRQSWPLLKEEMLAFFKKQAARDTTVNVLVEEWPKFYSKRDVHDSGRVPGHIWCHGPERKICLPLAEITSLAFDEEHGHLSHLFSGRLYRFHIRDTHHQTVGIEECVVSSVKAEPARKELTYLMFQRYVPEYGSLINIPVTLIGLFGCPASFAGWQIDLLMPTIELEVFSARVPPPLQVDCSRLQKREPYDKITLRDIQHLLPEDVFFAKKYNLDTTEIVVAFDHRTLEVSNLPEDWEDYNFKRKNGKKIHLTYGGFFPKQ